MASRRLPRLNEQFRREIGDLILREVRDPGLAGLVSITSVETSPDLRHARVFVSVLGDQEARERALAALQRASGFIRHGLAERLTLRHVPELTFRIDTSLERGERIMELLREVGPKPGEKPSDAEETGREAP